VTYTLEASLQLLDGETLVTTLAREVISSSTSSSKIPAIQSFPLTESQIRDAPKLTKTISSEVIEAKVTFPCVAAVGEFLPIQLDIEKLTKKAKNVKAKIKRYFYTGGAYSDHESETVLTHEFGTSLAANAITTVHLQLPIPETWIPTVLERDHDKTNQPARIRGRKTEVVLPNNMEALPREVLNVLPINMGVGYALSLSIDIAWSTDPKFDVPSGLFICTKHRNKAN